MDIVLLSRQSPTMLDPLVDNQLRANRLACLVAAYLETIVGLLNLTNLQAVFLALNVFCRTDSLCNPSLHYSQSALRLLDFPAYTGNRAADTLKMQIHISAICHLPPKQH